MAQHEGKQPFDVEVALARIEQSVRPYPPAAMFGLAAEGFATPFEQLLACIISIRTYDEVSVAAARRLFAHARTPAELLAQRPEAIDNWITPCAFHTAKAYQMLEIARVVQAEHGGALPCDFAALTALRGVGPKCANLVLGVACGEAAISVDVHVHRITNRWGYVHTATPEQTMAALAGILPRPLWVTINRLLVPFGKHICTGRAPRCHACPVLDMCAQVGVGE